METKFVPSAMRKWESIQRDDHTVYVSGWAAVGAHCMNAEQLAAHVLDAQDVFKDMLGQLRGHYAIVSVTPTSVRLAVDVIRSIPLLYQLGEGDLLISDDFERFDKTTIPLDLDSVAEYAAAGYVTGINTLLRDVKAVRPGECLSFAAPAWRPETDRHFEYTCTYDAHMSLDEACERLDEATTSTFGRLIDSLNGRQALVPLSGGFDSRKIASVLKRLGYDNVLCFSYGLPGNRESQIAKQVAKTLGFPWIQIAYSAEQWKDDFSSPEMKRFNAFCCNGTSPPYVDDWPAIPMLAAQRQVADNAVFIPGHTGNFICGGNLKTLFDPRYHDDPSNPFEALVKKHYALWDHLLEVAPVRAVIDQRMNEVLGHLPRNTTEHFAAIYEYWEWQERQAKYINNGIREFDFYGFESRIPFWDRQYMEFWQRVPLSLKLDKYLYRHYLSGNDPDKVFVEDAPKNVWDPKQFQFEGAVSFASKLKTKLRSAGALKRLYKYRDLYKQYRHGAVGHARAFNFLDYMFFDPSKRGTQSLIVRRAFRDMNLNLGRLPSEWRRYLKGTL